MNREVWEEHRRRYGSVRQICLYLVAVRVDCVCGCRFMAVAQ